MSAEKDLLSELMTMTPEQAEIALRARIHVLGVEEKRAAVKYLHHYTVAYYKGLDNAPADLRARINALEAVWMPKA